MAKSVNRVTLLGTLGKDIELKHTSGGTAVAKFSIACNERFKDKNGEWRDKVEWINVTCWGRLAEIASEYLAKGKQVYIEGKIQTDSWEKDGVTRYSTYVNASELVLLGGGGERSPRNESTHAARSNEVVDDDIPF